MTPKLALAVDPIFLYVLDLLDRIDLQEQPSPQEERPRIINLLDQAEAIVGSGKEWELSKYALVSWIDEMLVDAPWQGGEWWSNNVLEVEEFSTRLCHEQFYVRAAEASTLSRRDALEVFYVCVVLGFRGLYQDPEMSALLIESNGLPPDLDTWARQTSMSIRLGQGRPPLAGPSREIQGAPPLKTRTAVLWPWLTAGMFATCNAVYYFLFVSPR